jgi:hypothetical protein
MSNYTKTTNFLAKDSLPENDSGKIIKGSEFDTEFNALQTAVNTKADLASPALTGVPTAATATAGTNTTQLATTAFVTAADTAILAANNTFTGTQTFKDNKFEITDDSDATKKLNLQLSGITTATTRTLTVPNKNGTIATTDDLIQGAPLNTATNSIVSGSYAVTSSATITITATNTFAVGQSVFITFTNSSGSALTAGDFTIVTATGGSFTITYGSSVTSAGTCVTTRYGLIALATSSEVSARTNTLRAITPSALTLTSETAQATTSGTSIDFNGIPSWAKRVTVILNEVDIAGSDEVVILLGTASSFETTGYISSIFSGASYYDSTTSFRLTEPQVALSGTVTFFNISGNTWIASAAGKSGTSRIFVGGGSKTLASTLTRVQIKSSISSAFTSGSANIIYE